MEATLAITQPGDTAQLTFRGETGQAVFVKASSSTLSGCVLKLRDPVGKEIANGCIYDGVGYIGRTILPATGDYVLSLNPFYDATGEVTTRRFTVIDQDVPILADGTPVTATIDTPGASNLRFTGTAGTEGIRRGSVDDAARRLFPTELAGSDR